jgi:hypothetical protein
MPTFKQLVGSYDQARAGVHQAFTQLGDADIGRSVRLMASKGRDNPRYKKSLAEAAKFLGEVYSGRKPLWLLKEALSTSDFPLLFGDTIDRLMVAQYRAIEPKWRDYVRVSTVADFRAVKRFHCTRGSGRLDQVLEGAGYQVDAQAESTYSFSVAKYGRRRDILWEALTNDDLDALKATPDDLAWQAANTEYWFATSAFAANATLYATTGGGRPTGGNKGTAVLSATNLQAAIEQMSKFLSPEGQPMLNTPKWIVVPPALELTARQILQSATITYSGSTDRSDLPTLNILQGILDIRVNEYLPVIDTTNGHTGWYLFADPSFGWAIEVGFLRGHETPELFMKTANQVKLGGGAVSPLDGDFDNDAVAYKARHVLGGSHSNAVGGWRFTYHSDGTV